MDKIVVDMDTKVGRSLCRQRFTTQRVGLELEYEGCKAITDPLANWDTTIDHSLRSGGLEFVSRPLLAANIDNAVGEMLEAARSIGAKATKRCGLHVHVNVGQLTWGELYKYILYYVLLEPTLFKEFADGREMSHFCVPTWTNTALTQALYEDNLTLRSGIHTQHTDWVYVRDHICGREHGATRRLFSPWTPKYAAMNLSSIAKFGTLEFRQAPSSLDASFISFWSKLLLNIQTEALKYDTINDILDDYYDNGLFTLCEKVGWEPLMPADEMDQLDAEDAACMIAGHMPVLWNELKWEMK